MKKDKDKFSPDYDDYDQDYDQDNYYYEEEIERHRKVKHMLLGGIVVIILLIATILASARIKSIEIIGNTRYTNEEMVNLIFSETWDTNSFYCFIKDKTQEHKQIPFIQRYDIDWLGPMSVSVTVYEKNIVGYVDYMSSHMYFDKDGIVVESTSESLPGIPRISGLNFGSIVLYKELPVDNMKVFNDILNLTGALSESGIECDEILYDKLLNATVIIGDVEVYLGNTENMEMKVYTLKDILPKLEGLKGELDLSEYDEKNDHESYIFKGKN